MLFAMSQDLIGDDWHLQGYGQLGGRMGGFQGLNQSRGQQQGGQLEPQLPDTRQQGFAPASQNMAMLSGFQVLCILSCSVFCHSAVPAEIAMQYWPPKLPEHHRLPHRHRKPLCVGS